jgi:outer membrane protein OmpA-like peptidoglycan-associated protein
MDGIWRLAVRRVALAEPGAASASVLRRCGGVRCPPGTCDHDDTLRRHATRTGPEIAPPIVHDVLRSPGDSIEAGTRTALEARSGHDFSRVRIHADSDAAESARAVGARAYTVGSHIAFAAGEYRPQTANGRRLIAHELAHVLQQREGPAGIPPRLEVGSADDPAEHAAEAFAGSANGAVGGSAAPVMRRACPPTPTNIAASPLLPFPCTTADAKPVAGSIVQFCQDSTDVLDGQSAWIDSIVAEAKLSSAVEIHGYASPEGPSAGYNVTLSCMRASAFGDLLAARGVRTPVTLVAHGPTTGYGATPANRNVVVRTTLRRCGPDATDWFVRQVDAAKRDPAVLAVRANLAMATTELAAEGLSASLVAEGAVLTKVLEAERAAGNPPRTAAAAAQIAAGTPGEAELDTAKRDLVLLGVQGLANPGAALRAAVLGDALRRIRRAALDWAGLVGTKRRFDFKWDTGTMRRPSTANCPKDCDNTITLCPTTLSDCYRTDVPGNIFYAHVGRFVGWSELILQLGSEFAQLQANKSWDPPEDTTIISASFALPDPLTRSALCGMVAANPGVFDRPACANCTEPTTAVIR